jgi:hypothetical protein
MKKILFLLAAFSLFLTNHAVAEKASIHVNYGNGWIYAGSIDIDNAGKISNHASTSDETFIDSTLKNNGVSTPVHTTNEQQNNFIAVTDKQSINTLPYVDLSEPTSAIVLAAAVIFAALAKWRKSLSIRKKMVTIPESQNVLLTKLLSEES